MLKLSVKSIDNLQEIFHSVSQQVGNLSTQRSRFEEIDRYVQKSTDRSEATRKGQAARKAGNKAAISNMEIPVTHIYSETAHAYLVATFLTGTPLFAAVADRQHEDVASMLTALTLRDQIRFNWVSEYIQALRDAVMYPYFAVEYEWKAKRGNSAETMLVEGSSNTGTAKPILYEGNSVKRIDPYNLILDPAVPPNKVHSDGTYVGYVEQLNYIQVKEMYSELNNLYTIKKNLEAIFQCSASTQLYFRPKINDHTPQYNPNDWPTFFGVNAKVLPKTGAGVYEKVTLYRKIIPKEFDITLPSGGEPQIFKFIWINGLLAYAEPASSSHEYLPIIVGQLHSGDHSQKSFVEYLFDNQDLSTALLSAGLASMRRAVGDRAIYNPRMVRKEDVDSDNPVSKIPIISNSYNIDPRQAYSQIPYNDTVTPIFQSTLGMSMQLAEDVHGINRASQGNFIRGNKTMFEFDKIMSNSESRLQLGALNIESTFFAPSKEVLKMNYLVRAQNEEITNYITQAQINVDPVQLRQFAPMYKMASGIMPATKLANTEVLIQALQFMAADPIVSLEYDLGAITVSALKQQGFTDIESYRRTEEQMQQMAAMRGAQNEQQ